MIDFSTFIGSLITIIVCYITLNETTKNQQRKYLYIRIILLFLGTVVIFLYFFYEIKHITLSIILPTLKKMFPFEKGYFSNKNFAFSYIIESIIMVVIVLIFISYLMHTTVHSWNNYIIFKIISITLSISFLWVLIWFNNFLSNFLCISISDNFGIISFVFNIVTYLIIGILVALIHSYISNKFDYIYQKRNSNKLKAKETLDEFSYEDFLKEELKNFDKYK